MTLNLRAVALAAICSTLPLAAQASVLMVDFEGLGIAPDVQVDISVTQPFSGDKLTFSGPSGVFATGWGALAQAFSIPAPLVGPTFGGGIGFSLHIDTSACVAGADATVELGCFNRLSLNTFSGAGTINVFDTSSATTAVATLNVDGFSGSATGAWNSAVVNPGLILGLINRIDFTANQGGAIYFDDLNLTYVGPNILGPVGPGGPGGTVPEPAGLALVALALAGLGLTRRRAGRTLRA